MLLDPIRVLIADDSVIYRSQIKAALEQVDNVNFVGSASNGKLALDLISLKEIDLLLLDLEMPEMDGIEVLKMINQKGYKFRTVIFSSSSKRGAESALEALKLGASDFIAKPDGKDNLVRVEPWKIIKELIEPKIRALFPEHYSCENTAVKIKSPSILEDISFEMFKPKIVVIGSSTGGPSALESIFSAIRGELSCPVLITQHMPPVFTASLAERIHKISGIDSREAIDGEELKNQIYFAPGDFHMSLKDLDGRVCISLNQDPQINFVRPAVDPLFESASEIFKKNCLGFILTGMGSDGKNGAESIKKNNGVIVIQSEETCVVFGMPKAVKSCGAFDKELNLDEIIKVLFSKVIKNC